MRNFVYFFIVTFFSIANTSASTITTLDTIVLDIKEAETLFLKKNLLLLVSNYDIEMRKAQVIQSKVWPNPSVEFQLGVYNPTTDKYFDATKTGQMSVQLNQLIHLAGSRNKNVKLQKINTELAEAQLYDLLRTLKYELRSIFYDLYFKQQAISMFDSQIKTLKETVFLYQNQYKMGNIPAREVVRLQAFLISLENEKYEINKVINQHLEDMYVLLGDTIRPYYRVEVADKNAESFLDITYSIDSLYQLALDNRSDIRIKQLEVAYSNQSHVFERSKAYPDAYVGGIWDRQSNYIPNYSGLVLSIDLPVFNRNQGNIAIAKNQYQKSKVQLELAEQTVLSEVLTAHRQVSDYNLLYKYSNNSLIVNFDSLIVNFVSNYKKRNITLIEFIDFYETYKNYKNDLYELYGNRLQAIEYLNYTIGVAIYETK